MYCVPCGGHTLTSVRFRRGRTGIDFGEPTGTTLDLCVPAMGRRWGLGRTTDTGRTGLGAGVEYTVDVVEYAGDAGRTSLGGRLLCGFVLYREYWGGSLFFGLAALFTGVVYVVLAGRGSYGDCVPGRNRGPFDHRSAVCAGVADILCSSSPLACLCARVGFQKQGRGLERNCGGKGR